jgi:hypothetical protein
MPRRLARPFRQHRIPRCHSLHPTWSHDGLLTVQQAVLSGDFRRFAMHDAEDDQMSCRQEQPDYSRKDFKRAAEDLYSCLQEALEFFRKFDTEFTAETKEIKKYGDAELLDIIWEKKVLRFENGPRDAATNVDNGARNNMQYGGNQGNEPSSRSSSSTSTSSMKSLQLRLHLTVEAILECKSPVPIKDDDGVEIRIEEVRDFEDRMRKTALRLYNSLGSICYEVQAFRRVIRDLTTMSQDLSLFPLNLWKADGQDSQYHPER